MTDDEVHGSFVKWLKEKTGLTVIKAYQSADRPSGKYLMVNLLSVNDLTDHPQFIDYNEATTLNSEGKNEVEATPMRPVGWGFSVHSYGDNPTDALRSVKSLSALAQYIEGENMLPNIIIHSMGEINHVPDYVNEKWEARAVMTAQLRGAITHSAVVDTVDEHTINVTKN